MPIANLYHKRLERIRGELPDVYVYNNIPPTLRVQIVHIMHELLGDKTAYCNDYRYGRNEHVIDVYRSIVTVLRKEFGVFQLPYTSNRYNDCHLDELTDFLLEAHHTEHFLSALELICKAIEMLARKFDYRHVKNASEKSKDAIKEINGRFKEHGIGYEYINGEIIKVDTELVHAEAVKPALSLLQNPSYKGAQEEFLKAHSHYRQGNNKDALTNALKALESTLKTICDKKGWKYDKKDAASKLIQVCFDNGLIDIFWQSHFSALISTLKTGVPTARNKLGGHGQGKTPTTVPDYLAAYVLHMTASAIVFLVKAEQELPCKT